VRAFVVDAFTDTVFGGNPAGVVLCDLANPPPRTAWMQQVAAEFRHAETAFLRRRGDGDHDLRWFTPLVEVDLCGHATLASAHVLASLGVPGPLRFHTRSGVLTATVDGAAITLDFPAQPVHPCAVPDGLAAAFGIEVPVAYTNDVDVLVEVPDASTLAALAPDLRALREVPCRGVVVTAAAEAGADHDFVSRFFAPRVGVDEDPVTGSAHCALGPYWGKRLGRGALSGVQLSPRRGRVGVELRGARVSLRGSAVTFLEGQLRA